MNSFYILLFAGIITGSLTGYFAGFARIILFLIKLLIAAVIGCALCSSAASVIKENTLPVAEWALPIAFMCVFVSSFFILQLIECFIRKRAFHVNTKVLNNVMGGMAGFVLSIAFVLVLIKATGVVSIPDEVNGKVQWDRLNAAAGDGIALINDNALPLFKKQQVQVMSIKAMDSTAEKGISLSFATNEYSIEPLLEAQMLLLINQERNRYGLQPLIADTALIYAARMHSSDMLRRGYFSHNTPEGVDPFQRLHKLNITYLYAGENLAMAPTVVKANEELMKSPGHRANILNHYYGRVGIGVVDAGIHGLMITQEFRN